MKMKNKSNLVVYFLTRAFIQIRVYITLAWHAGGTEVVHRGYWLDKDLVFGNRRLESSRRVMYCLLLREK